MKAPISSRKHYVQHTEFTVNSGTVTNQDIIVASAIQSVDTPSEVVEGSIVKAVYIERWLRGFTNDTSMVLTVEKSPSGRGPATFTDMSTLDAYTNKKNVLYTTQGLVAENTQNAIPFVRQWIKIPKGKQRFGLGDRLRVNVAVIGSSNLLGCGLDIFKSYN